VAGWLAIVRALRAEHPTHAILFKRFFRNEFLARLSGARIRIGFRTRGRSRLLTHALDYREGTSITRQNLALAALLGADPTDATPMIGLTSEDRRAAAERMASAGLEAGRFVAAHYGGLSTDPAFLPPEAFAARLREFAEPDEPIVLVGAGAREAGAAARIAATDIRILRWLDLPLLETAAVLAQARGFLGMNSGPAHLAAAVGTPATILFRPGPGADAEIDKWRPERADARAEIAGGASMVSEAAPGGAASGRAAPGPAAPTVGLAIPAYRNAPRLARALDSVARMSPALLERAVVVDDSGDGRVAAELQSRYPRVTWIINEPNRGFGASATRAVAACPADVVVLLNDDVELESETGPALTALFTREDVFAVTFRSVDETGQFREGAKRLVWPLGMPRIRHNERDQRPREAGLLPSDYAVGGHAAFHRGRFLELGGFDPAFEPFYWEDVDLSRRAIARGWQVAYEPSIRVRHAREGAIRSSHDARRIRLVTQTNRIRFARRHRPAWAAPWQELALAWYALTDPLFREALRVAASPPAPLPQADVASPASIDSTSAATRSTESPSGS
jgi:GT2 family glycosyltransferase